MLEIVALNRAVPTAAAAKTAAKESIEDTFKAAHTAFAAEPVKIKPACAAAHLGAVKAELIVAFPLLRVAQNLVGFVQLLEAFFGALIIRVQIGGAFLGFFAIRRFDLRIRGVLGNAQNLIIIALCQKLTYLHSINRITAEEGLGA